MRDRMRETEEKEFIEKNYRNYKKKTFGER